MSKVEFIQHGGRRLLHFDLSGAKDNAEECFEVIQQLGELVHKEPENSVLAVVDIRDAFLTPKLTGTIKDNASKNRRHIKAAAIIGATGMKKIIMQTVAIIVNKNIKIFDDFEEAKDWLIQQR